MFLQNPHIAVSRLGTPHTADVAPVSDALASRAELIKAALFIAAHIPLALLMRQSELVATAHALVVFAIGFGWAAFGRRPMQVGFVAAYITGAEVLWRMNDAGIFWESGKYVTIAIFLVALFRVPHLRLPELPFIYFALLIPSAFLTLVNFPLGEARQQISFNLSGPLALTVSAWFFFHLRLSSAQIYRLFLMLLAPIIGVACLTFSGIMTATNIEFGTEANFATSGGFGPNQVSAVLGLGALIAFWFVINEKTDWKLRILMCGGLLVLAAQSALTFSRGGLYSAVGAMLLAALYLARDTGARLKLLALAALLFVVSYSVIFPNLDAFTGGALSNRLQDTSLTGRDLIIKTDLQIWRENPLLGVGPGGAAPLHEILFRDAAAHTEFSRLVAEHGLLGFAAILLLITMAWRNLLRTRSTRRRAIVASLIAWSFLFMCVDAVRLVAPVFLFGLTFAALSAEETPPAEPLRSGRYGGCS